jgi:UDP-N-acetylglucosamine 4,6-dehydratase
MSDLDWVKWKWSGPERGHEWYTGYMIYLSRERRAHWEQILLPILNELKKETEEAWRQIDINDPEKAGGEKSMREKTILITGGTGSFGKNFVAYAAHYLAPKKIIVFSRDEFKQSEMAQGYNNVRFMLGDVRDKSRLKQVFKGVDYVVHAAALKQVPALEYNPTEAVSTNVDGARNIVEAAIECGVGKVVALSTDKAVNPVNLYGATKLCMEKIFTAANAFGETKFSCVRYGNVIGSRGSVIPLFKKLKEQGITEFPITDLRMTRFWITLGQAVDLVLSAFSDSQGGRIYVPKIPSAKITTVARAICPNCTFKEIGIRPGEKLHEVLVSEDNANVYYQGGVKAEPGYASDTNHWQLTEEEMRCLIG